MGKSGIVLLLALMSSNRPKRICNLCEFSGSTVAALLIVDTLKMEEINIGLDSGLLSSNFDVISYIYILIIFPVALIGLKFKH